jgi:eukaryotic-like serine/threonine-protein kinase
MPNVAPLHANDLRRVGRYRLTGRITGLPADGPVFLAAMANGGQVTLTLLDADWTQNGAARDRFTAEARVARRVAPFCTARILDAGLDEGQAYLVSEYVAGPSLAEFIADQGPCASSGLSALAAGTATGLTAIHQAGLVHGQFGPDHVVLGVSGPRVVGFGITPPYGNATPAADMLAWANTVLFAAAGRSAADAGDLAKLAEPLRSLVARCAVPDAAGRPAAQTVLAELLGADDQAADLLAEGSRQAVRAAFRPPPVPAGREPQPAARRTGAIWWTAGIVVCVLAIVVAVHVLQNQSARSAAAKAPAPGTVPRTLAGTWSGQATQQTDIFSVLVKLAGGTTAGTIRYAGTSFTCVGQLSLMSDAGGELTMHQGITVGQHTCANGVVTLKPGPSGALQFKFTGAAGPTAAGSLTRP